MQKPHLEEMQQTPGHGWLGWSNGVWHWGSARLCVSVFREKMEFDHETCRDLTIKNSLGHDLSSEEILSERWNKQTTIMYA